jgi:hypothetical protein
MHSYRLLKQVAQTVLTGLKGVKPIRQYVNCANMRY